MQFSLEEKDFWGVPLGERFILSLNDLDFERKLKAFDRNLKLLFNKKKQRWAIVEKRQDGSGWNILFCLEDRGGEPKGLGDWVINKLIVMRANYEAKRRNADQFEKLLENAESDFKSGELKKTHQENRLRIVDDINVFRKAYKNLMNEPISDVTAGYPKANYKNSRSVNV